jgi:AAA domain/Family of unknown function (DUF6511)
MAISLASLNRTTALKSSRILIHGVHGVGKTTFAAGAPDPVFLLTEDGLGTLAVPHFPLARTFDEVMQVLAALYTEEHTFRTLVVDSVDWLEPLVHARACKDQGWSSIEDPGYGKGYVHALDLWRQYIEGLNALRDDTCQGICHRRRGMIDPTRHERAAMDHALGTAGEYIESLGQTDLMAWSPNEFAMLIEVIVTAFTDRLRELGDDAGEVPYP